MAGNKKVGRPELYTQKLSDKLCEKLADGESMRKACTPDNMPSKATVFKWLRSKPEFLDQYERAKQEAADSLVDDMLDIADNEFEDTQRSRLRVDTRKWISSKLKPKKYGDKAEETAKPQDINIQIVDPYATKPD